MWFIVANEQLGGGIVAMHQTLESALAAAATMNNVRVVHESDFGPRDFEEPQCVGAIATLRTVLQQRWERHVTTVKPDIGLATDTISEWRDVPCVEE